MKNIILQSAFIVFISLLILSCDESFNPKTEFEEGYSLFCVIDGNSSYQTAYITKNYNPADLNPENYTEDKSISGAEITLTCSDTVYKFRDTTLINSEDGKGYGAYYLNNFSERGEEMFISAILPDMNTITGRIKSTKKNLTLVYSSSRDIIYNLEEGYFIGFHEKPDAFYFVPSLFINYTVSQNNIEIQKRIEVPILFYTDGDLEIPQYPDLSLREGYTYPISLIEKTLRKIADFNPSNSLIKIRNITLEILEVSDQLAAYYLLNQSFNDGYSVKIQRAKYTNVDGGNGLLGYKYKYMFNKKFHPDWQTPIINMGYIFER